MIFIKKRRLCLLASSTYSFICLCLILYWLYTQYHHISDAGKLYQDSQVYEGDKNPQKYIDVEIWGKASISIYLWKHILGGSVISQNNGFTNIGNLTIGDFKFHFKNGPGFIQTTVPQNVEYLVLVLNGRTASNAVKACQWIDYLKKLKRVKKVCVVLLGNEQCQNEWLLPYMASKGGIVNAAFIVYDSTLIDNKEIFQWPLGVAEYRGFPNYDDKSVDVYNKRPYIANFVGTVYANSSREFLVNLIKKKNWMNKIHLIERNKWIPNETKETIGLYIEALKSSDLTLSPVGMNSECYRIYEALALGSVPVVENSVSQGDCARAHPAPLRLLKHHQVPIIWLTNWTEVADILHRESSLTFKHIIDRRIKVLSWYKNFKHLMKLKFLNVLKFHFL